MRTFARSPFAPPLLLALAGAAAFAFFALRADRAGRIGARVVSQQAHRAGGEAGPWTIAPGPRRPRARMAPAGTERWAPAAFAAPETTGVKTPEDWRVSPRLWLFSDEDRALVQSLLEAFGAAERANNWQEMQRLSKQFRDLGARAVAPLLDVLLRDPDDRMRIFAASILGEIQDSVPAGLLRDALRAHALPFLETMVSSAEDAAVRHHSIVALGKIGDPASFDFLADTLRRSEGWPFEGDAIGALGAIRDDHASAQIADLAERESNPRMRERLARALGERKDTAAAGPLEDLATRDVDPGVREAGAAALGDLGNAAADRVLRDIAGGQDAADVRAAAAQALGRPNRTGPIHFLRGVLGSTDDREVRSAAWLALRTIGTAEAREAIAPYPPAVRVDGVIPGTQAARLHLSANDTITRYNGKSVKDAGALRDLVLSTPAQKVVPLVVDHGGWTTTHYVHGGLLGLRIQDGVVLD